jgi:hypothetical protein
MNITFLSEPRKAYNIPNTEPAVENLGSWKCLEVAIKLEWRKPTQALVRFVAPSNWVQQILFPSVNPGSTSFGLRRARYITIQDQNMRELVLILDNCTPNDLKNGFTEVKALGVDPRYYLTRMPGSMTPAANPAEWIAIRSYLLQQLTRRVSNLTEAVPGMIPAQQRLPIKPINLARNPSAAERAIGIIRPNDIENLAEYTLANPDPRPPSESWSDLESSFTEGIEIYPLYIGTAATGPYWEWVLRQRVDNTAILLSQEDGTLSVSSLMVNNDSEVMATLGSDYSQFALTGGRALGRTNLSNAWVGVKVESVEIPSGTLSVDAALQSRAVTLTAENPRMTIDATANFIKAGIKATAGMIVSLRLYESIFPVPVDVCGFEWTSDTGEWAQGTERLLARSDYSAAAVPVDNSVHLLVHSTGVGGYDIPTNNKTNSYAWDVYVNGALHGSYTGTGATTSTGIPLVLPAGDHDIVIRPTDGLYSAGWARAFGYSTGTTGANATANRAKLIRVYSDPDFSHCVSPTDTGSSFKSNIYSLCTNLVEVPPERLPVTLTTLGTDYRNRAMDGCTSLEEAAAEAPLPVGVTVIPASYRQEQHRNNTSLRTAPMERFGPSIVTVGSSYRSGMYQGATALTSVLGGSEAWSSTVTTCGSSARQSQFEGCVALGHSLREAWQPIATVTSWHRERMYYGCVSIKAPASPVETTFGPLTTSVGDYYRRAMWQGSGVKLTQQERFPAVTGALAIGSDFKAFTYMNCLSLVSASPEVFPVSTGNTTISSGFREGTFYGATALKTAIPEAFSNKVISCGGRFRAETYRLSGVTTIGSHEVASTTCTTVGQFFRYGTWRATPLVLPPNEARPVTAAGTYPTNFRDSTFYDCTQLVRVAEEHDFGTMATVPNSWRNQTYRNANLSESIGRRVVPVAEKALVKGTQYRENCWNNTVPSDALPMLYSDNTSVLSSTNGMPANIY